MHLTPEEQSRFDALLEPIVENDAVQSMKTFVQHGTVSTFDHCLTVAQTAFALNSRMHLGGDECIVVHGGMLHDLFLYDWHDSHWTHSYKHAEYARRNAVTHLNADVRVQAVIRTHMWPIGITHVPASREAWIVCMADKMVSAHETVLQRADGNPFAKRAEGRAR